MVEAVINFGDAATAAAADTAAASNSMPALFALSSQLSQQLRDDGAPVTLRCVRPIGISSNELASDKKP
jgi:hypothetical protein